MLKIRITKKKNNNNNKLKTNYLNIKVMKLPQPSQMNFSCHLMSPHDKEDDCPLA